MYRVEIFNMFTRSFVSSFVLDRSTTIVEDYISPRSFDVTAPADIRVDLKNTVYIEDAERSWGYRGSFYVSGIQRDKTKTVISLSPLILLFNEKSMQNIEYVDWAAQLNNQIWYDFRQPTPSLYSLPVTPYGASYPTSNWGGVNATYGAELLNDMDCFILAATTYGKFIRFDVNVSSGWLGVPCYGFLKFTNTITVEADLDNIIRKDINETKQGGYNIRMFWYPQSAGSTAYYHYDGVLVNGVVQAATSRLKAQITDPRIISKVSDNPSPTSDDYWSFWKQSLKPSADSFEISITVKDDDRLVRPSTLRIGQPATIKSGGKDYSTYLTGKEIHRDTITLKFGTVRQALTAQLNQEGI